MLTLVCDRFYDGKSLRRLRLFTDETVLISNRGFNYAKRYRKGIKKKPPLLEKKKSQCGKKKKKHEVEKKFK